MDRNRHHPDIAEVTFQALDRSERIDDDRQRGCGLSKKCMIAIVSACVAIGFIGYMFANSSGIPPPAGIPPPQVTLKSRTGSSGGTEEDDMRLPRSILPTEYRLKIIPHLEEGNFSTSGDLQIHLVCKEPVRQIHLHAYELMFAKKDVQVLKEPAKLEILVKRVKFMDISETVIIELKEILQKDANYSLHVKFNGKLDTKLKGFYRSKYVDSATNETRWMAVTQFSPTYGRRAFPCFDEPSFKSVFTISIGRRENMTALSNMPQTTTESIDGMPGFEWAHFKKSVPMSTYLVAFVVSDIGCNEVKNTSKPELKLWARRDVLNQTEYVSGIVPKILQFLEHHFNLSFPLEKQDMVAVPDFGYSAMENWGLITFRESFMLVDETETSAFDKELIGMAVGHEIAHAWFGNLVTPKWWSEVWLKEGFASFFAYMALDVVEPTWRMSDFITINLRQILEFDALESTLPLTVTINHTQNIAQVFNSISYLKGCAIINMLSCFIGADPFKLGLNRYLHTYAYKNADQDDLWTILTNESHSNGSLSKDLSVKRIMHTWTMQAGYPILHVRRNYETGEITVEQERFIKTRQHKNSTNLWWIPLTWTSKNDAICNDTMPKAWLNVTSLKLNDTIPSDQWVLFNLCHSGYYRVNYDVTNWKLLKESRTTLPEITRAQLLDDALAASRAGHLGYNISMDLVRSLENETDFLVWDAAIPGLTYIYNRLHNYTAFVEFMQRSVHKVFEMVGTTKQSNDDHRTLRWRPNILNWACTIGHDDCLNWAYEKFQKWMNLQNSENPIPVNLRRWVYCTGMSRGAQEEWDFLWNQYLKSHNTDILRALGCLTDEDILSSYLEKIIINDSGIRDQDVAIVFHSVASNPAGKDIAFEFFKRNWTTIKKNYGEGFSVLSGMVSAFSKYMDTELQLQQLEELLNSIDIDSFRNDFDKTIEEVRLNVAWRSTYRKEIENILNKIST